MVFKISINSSSKEGGVQRGKLWTNVNMWITSSSISPSHATMNTLRKSLMFSTENHKITLGQFGASLSKAPEESFLTASPCRLFCPTAREENRLRKLMVSYMYRTASYEAQGWCEDYGLVQNSSPPKSAPEKRGGALCTY